MPLAKKKCILKKFKTEYADIAHTASKIKEENKDNPVLEQSAPNLYRNDQVLNWVLLTD